MQLIWLQGNPEQACSSMLANRAPTILWYSKKQNAIESSSTFGSEFMALKSGMKLLEGLRYKIRMMGIGIDGHAHVRVDNKSVVKNASIPESSLDVEEEIE
jgi:hypothetical protein